jgi:bifunctional non-homologous end joining protein LigD
MDITLTHPEKILYPDAKITKLQLADYYEKVADQMLPYVINRPLTLLRCPDGIENNSAKACFYQKHLNENQKNVKHLYTINIKEKHATEKYIYIKDVNGLLTLVQMGVLEIHPWPCKIDNLEKPDMVIFDLDPGPTVPWKRVIAAAQLVKEELAAIGLESYVRITGGKGLHLVVPFQRRYAWEKTIHFVKVFAQYLEQKYPVEFVATMAKSKRHNKIFVDYLRNMRGSTAIANFSTRAKPGATVAVPIDWSTLSVKVKPDQYTVKNIAKYYTLNKHPWHGFNKNKQTLPDF